MILRQLSTQDLQLQKLIEIYRRAEIQIEKELTRKRALDLVDFAEQAALKRVRETLNEMTAQAEAQAPMALESFFDTTAESLTTTKTSVVQTLVNNYMGKIDEAAEVTFESAKEFLTIGRLAADEFRTLSLERVAEATAIGKGWRDAQRKMAIDLNNKGITAFTDKAGRQWDLTSYCSMLTRTTARQAQTAAVLTESEQDLWQILPHGTTCPICAAYQGRVYSKSGNDPDYPPLASAFGKIDPLGSNDLTNTYLNIHPNCLVPGGLVLCEGVVSESRRLYRGEVVTFKTSRGDEITVTPNHPILTDRGFIAAGLLKKGDKVIQTTGKYASLIRQTPNNIHVPTAVDEIFHTLMQTRGGSSLTVESTAKQFHGDGIPDSEVNIIFSDSLGKRKINAMLSEEVGKHNFPTARLGRFALFSEGTLAKIVKRTFFARNRRMTSPCFVGGVERVPENLEKFSNGEKTTTADFGNFRKCLALIMEGKETLKLRAVRFFICLRNNTMRFTPGSARRIKPKNFFGTFDIAHRYPEFFGYLSSGEPLLKKRLKRLWVKNGIVESVVSHVSTSVYDGYVYNFETKYGFYTYNNIVTHNCLCTLAPYTTAGKTDEEIQKDKDFSSFEKRPADVDYRTEQQRDEYRAKEKARAEYRNTKKQFEKYKAAGVDDMPVRLSTFEKHKKANDDVYKGWERKFRQLNLQSKQITSEIESDIIKAGYSEAKTYEEALQALTEQIGFRNVDDDLKKLDKELILANTNQLGKLEKKFGAIHESYIADIISEKSGNANAYVSSMLTLPTRQDLSLCPKSYKKRLEHIASARKGVESFWSMPCALTDEELQLYSVTHEYGHMIQNVLVQRLYEADGWSVANNLSFIDHGKSTRKALYKWYYNRRNAVQNECYDEILKIARERNAGFDIDKNLSMYGKTDKAEFFAEVFANSQLSTPNELGEAMNIWLERKGLIK